MSCILNWAVFFDTLAAIEGTRIQQLRDWQLLEKGWVRYLCLILYRLHLANLVVTTGLSVKIFASKWQDTLV